MEEVKNTEYGALYQRYARRLYGFFLRQLNHDTLPMPRTKSSCVSWRLTLMRFLQQHSPTSSPSPTTSCATATAAKPTKPVTSPRSTASRWRPLTWNYASIARRCSQPFAKCSTSCRPHSAYCSRFVTRKSSRCRKWRRYSKSPKAP